MSFELSHTFSTNIIKVVSDLTYNTGRKTLTALILRCLSIVQLILLIMVIEMNSFLFQNNTRFDLKGLQFLEEIDNPFDIFFRYNVILALILIAFYMGLLVYFIFESYAKSKGPLERKSPNRYSLLFLIHSNFIYYIIHVYTMKYFEVGSEYEEKIGFTIFLSAFDILSILIAILYTSFCYCPIFIPEKLSRKGNFHLLTIDLIKIIFPTIKGFSTASNLSFQTQEIVITIILISTCFYITDRLPDYKLKLNKVTLGGVGVALCFSFLGMTGSILDSKDLLVVPAVLIALLFCKLASIVIDLRTEGLITDLSIISKPSLILHVTSLLEDAERNIKLNLRKEKFKRKFFGLRGYYFELHTEGIDPVTSFQSWKNKIMKNLYKNQSKFKKFGLISLQEIQNSIEQSEDLMKNWLRGQMMLKVISNITQQATLIFLTNKLKSKIREVSQKELEANFENNQAFDFLQHNLINDLTRNILDYCSELESFWEYVGKSTLHIKSINEHAEKLKKVGREVDLTWNELENLDHRPKNFVYLLYGCFLSELKNFPSMGNKLISKYTKIFNKSDFNMRDSLIESNVFVTIRGSAPNLGCIISVSEEFTTIFGYLENEVIGKNIDIIMPEVYSNVHDRFIQRYFESSDSKLTKKISNVLAQSKNGNILPVEVNISVDINIEGELVLRGNIKLKKMNMDYIILNERGQISDYSHSLGKILNITSDDFFHSVLLEENSNLIKQLLSHRPIGNDLRETIEDKSTSRNISFRNTSMNLNADFFIEQIISKGSFIFLKPFAKHDNNNFSFACEEIPFFIKINPVNLEKSKFYIINLRKIEKDNLQNDLEGLDRTDLEFFLNQDFFEDSPAVANFQKDATKRTTSAYLKASEVNHSEELEADLPLIEERNINFSTSRHSGSVTSGSKEQKTKMIDKIQEELIKRPFDQTRNLIEYSLLAIKILIIILSIVVYTSSDSYLKQISKGIEIITLSYHRLDSALWSWRMMLTYQIRIQNIKAYTANDFVRYKAVLEKNLPNLKEYNHELRDSVAGNSLYDEFFSKSIGINSTNEYGDFEMKYYDLFQSADIFISNIIKFLNYPDSVKLDQQGKEYVFLTKNMQNDFLEKSVKLVDLSKINLDNLKEEKLTGLIYIFVVVGIIIIGSAVLLLWNLRIFILRLEGLFRHFSTIEEDEINLVFEKIKKMRNLASSHDYRPENKSKLRLMTESRKFVKNSERRKASSKVISKSHYLKSKYCIVAFLFFSLFLIGGLFVWSYIGTKSSIDELLIHLDEISAIGYANYITTLIVCVNYFSYASYYDGLLFNRPLKDINLEIIEKLSNNDYLTDVFAGPKGYIYPLVDTFFTGNFCSLISNFTTPGRNINNDCKFTTSNYNFGLLEAQIDVYQKSIFIRDILEKNNSFAYIKQNYHYIDDYITAPAYTFDASYNILSDFVESSYENSKNPIFESQLLNFGIQMSLTILIILVYFAVFFILMNNDAIFGNILRQTPSNEFFKNKLLKSYMTRIYNGKIDFIKMIS